jgi:hypothetical protein
MKAAKSRARPRQEAVASALLGESVRAFLTEPIAINVSSRGQGLFPSIARAYGCRLDADRARVTIFLAAERAQAVLEDLRAGAPIAVAFCRPNTHATVQLKGAYAEVAPLAPDDRALMRAYGKAFHAEIVSLGFSESFTDALAAPVGDESAVAVTFTPIAAFEQTPGPDAGKQLLPKP